MTRTLEWNPILPIVPLVLAAAASLAALLALEWKRKQKFRSARLASQFIIVLCLFGLLARPSSVITSPAGPLVVLTSGYNPHVVDSLVAAVSGLLVVSLPGAEPDTRAIKVTERDIPLLSGNPVWVAGSGLPRYALSEIPFGFSFLPAPTPEGITDVTVPRHLTVDVPAQIRGTYHANGAGAGRRWIRLVGPGGPEDSTSITTAGDTAVSLNLVSAVPGTLMYRVDETDSAGNVLQSSSLPIYVQQPKKLEVLIISDYPTFELRHLKNFLADKGHRVGMRNRVSRNRYHQEFANRPAYNLNLLTAAILENVDVLIVDQASHAAMSGSERNHLMHSLQSGLGLIFLPAATTPGSHQLITFNRLTGEQDTVQLQLQGTRATLPALALKPTGEISPLITAERGRVVAGCRCTGDLKIGFQLLRETYQLGLQGKSAIYSSLWTPLLEKVAREHEADFRISIDSEFPVFTNEPQDISVVSSGAMPDTFYDGVKVPLVEDVRVDDWWHGRLWADGNRWHRISADSTMIPFFDLHPSEWNALRVARQMKSNANHLGQSKQQFRQARRRNWDTAFFVFFVLASGFLWLAPKV
jgi:hypothetical protein